MIYNNLLRFIWDGFCRERERAHTTNYIQHHLSFLWPWAHIKESFLEDYFGCSVLSKMSVDRFVHRKNKFHQPATPHPLHNVVRKLCVDDGHLLLMWFLFVRCVCARLNQWKWVLLCRSFTQLITYLTSVTKCESWKRNWLLAQPLFKVHSVVLLLLMANDEIFIAKPQPSHHQNG